MAALTEAEEISLEARVKLYIESQVELFNVINIDDHNHVTYELDERAGLPLYRLPIVEHSPFPTIQLFDLSEKMYYTRAIDTCKWNGMRCMYKQIQFDSMIGSMCREIQLRERILQHGRSLGSISPLTRAIAPILGIVVHSNPALLLGILLPDAGPSLDNIAPNEIGLDMWISLIQTVRELRVVGITHGDICDRNICVRGNSIQLIDFGEIAPDYPNDVIATGELLNSYANRMALGPKKQERVSDAAQALMDQRLEEGLAMLQEAKLSSLIEIKPSIEK
jgi:hypothetical protein